MLIKPGTTLIQAKPFAHCLSAEFKSVHCDQCFKASNQQLRRCSSCKFMHYCSTQCQQLDWSVHKHECKPLAALLTSSNQDLKKSLQNDQTRLFLRILIKLREKGDDGGASQTGDQAGLKTFESLMDHYPEVSSDHSRLAPMQACFLAVKQLMGEDFIRRFSIKELISCYGKMIINSFSITNDDMSKSLGSGLYLSPASLDHSCEPNCVVVFEGIHLQVQVIAGYESTTNQPFISYVDLLVPRSKRASYLLKNYYFACRCSRCQDAAHELDERMLQTSGQCLPTASTIDGPSNKDLSIECKRSITTTEATKAELDALMREIEMVIESPSENKSRAIYYLANSGQVHGASGRDYSDRSIYCSSEEVEEGCGDDDDDLGNVKLTRRPAPQEVSRSSSSSAKGQSYSIESIERLLAKALRLLVLPTHNIYIVYLSEILMEKCIDGGVMYERAYEVASKYLLNAYRFYLPRNHPTTSLHLLKLVKLALYLIDEGKMPLKVALKDRHIADHLAEATQALKLTHPSSESIGKELESLQMKLKQLELEQ